MHNKTQVCFMKITDTAIREYGNFMSIPSEEKRQQLETYRFNIDKALSLYAELLVRQHACRTLKISESDIIFEQNEYGKPFLKNHTGFHFNVAHTHNAIVAAFSDSPVGVDVERVRDFDPAIAKRFFMLQELDYILQASDQSKAFYEIWTKKEAYIKYLGRGLSVALNSFNVLDTKINNMIASKEQYGYITSLCGDRVMKSTLIQQLRVIDVNCFLKPF